MAEEVVVMTHSPGLRPSSIPFDPRRAERGDMPGAVGVPAPPEKLKGCVPEPPATPAVTSTRLAAADAAAAELTATATAAVLTAGTGDVLGGAVTETTGVAEEAWSKSTERDDGGGFRLASAITASAISRGSDA